MCVLTSSLPGPSGHRATLPKGSYQATLTGRLAFWVPVTAPSLSSAGLGGNALLFPTPVPFP